MHTLGHSACHGWRMIAAIAETARWSHACAQWTFRVSSQTKEISVLWALIILVVLWLSGFSSSRLVAR
jgi:hypothetical protein